MAESAPNFQNISVRSTLTTSPSFNLHEPPPPTSVDDERLFVTEDHWNETLGGEAQNILEHTSLTGSIHELQDGEEKVTTSLAKCDLSEDSEEDNFEDAKDHLSPQRKLSRESSVAPSSPTKGNLVNSDEWKYQPKHIFVLSEAGKPIYCLHGDEDELSSLMAVMQAHVAFVQDMGDTMRSIHTTDTTIVFLTKGPLILVAVSHGMESVTQLIVQLTYVYNQLLSVLTLSQLTKIFEQRKNYDLRRMIGGSERLIDHLANSMDTDPSFMLSAVRVLPLSTSSRSEISTTISQSCSKIKNVVFAILMADNQLITLVRMKKYFIHPADLHLIFNLVNSSESFKHSESWTPICLPKFDSSGFLHAHVSYLSDDCPACLVMLTVERDSFFELSEAKKKIVKSLEKNNLINGINLALCNSVYTPSMIGVPEIRHFLYKSRTSAQFTSPEFIQPYETKEQQQRLHQVYVYVQSRLHSSARPMKLVYYSGKHENVIGWVTQSFEIYAALNPMSSKVVAIDAVNKLLRWSKKEENSLFILTAPTF